MKKRLYVGNLNYNTTEHKVSELFGEIGKVVSANLIIDRHTGRSKGFAFVEMAEQGAAQKAIDQLNGREVNGREMKVVQARPQKPRRNKSHGGSHYGRH
jgi:RNA recognition motif-containing protein